MNVFSSHRTWIFAIWPPAFLILLFFPHPQPPYLSNTCGPDPLSTAPGPLPKKSLIRNQWLYTEINTQVGARTVLTIPTCCCTCMVVCLACLHHCVLHRTPDHMDAFARTCENFLTADVCNEHMDVRAWDKAVCAMLCAGPNSRVDSVCHNIFIVCIC